jgi:hypothetical protein
MVWSILGFLNSSNNENGNNDNRNATNSFSNANSNNGSNVVVNNANSQQNILNYAEVVVALELLRYAKYGRRKCLLLLVPKDESKNARVAAEKLKKVNKIDNFKIIELTQVKGSSLFHLVIVNLKGEKEHDFISDIDKDNVLNQLKDNHKISQLFQGKDQDSVFFVFEGDVELPQSIRLLPNALSDDKDIVIEALKHVDKLTVQEDKEEAIKQNEYALENSKADIVKICVSSKYKGILTENSIIACNGKEYTAISNFLNDEYVHGRVSTSVLKYKYKEFEKKHDDVNNNKVKRAKLAEIYKKMKSLPQDESNEHPQDMSDEHLKDDIFTKFMKDLKCNNEKTEKNPEEYIKENEQQFKVPSKVKREDISNMIKSTSLKIKYNSNLFNLDFPYTSLLVQNARRVWHDIKTLMDVDKKNEYIRRKLIDALLFHSGLIPKGFKIDFEKSESNQRTDYVISFMSSGKKIECMIIESKKQEEMKENALCQLIVYLVKQTNEDFQLPLMGILSDGDIWYIVDYDAKEKVINYYKHSYINLNQEQDFYYLMSLIATFIENVYSEFKHRDSRVQSTEANENPDTSQDNVSSDVNQSLEP